MRIYKVSEGKLYLMEGSAVTKIGQGYSGADPHKNQPASENIPNQGPIPGGVYLIGPAHDTETHGPHVLPLQPLSVNEMYGRSAFLIHGDSVKEPGSASEGCIILPRNVREKISASTDKTLTVVT